MKVYDGSGSLLENPNLTVSIGSSGSSGGSVPGMPACVVLRGDTSTATLTILTAGRYELVESSIGPRYNYTLPETGVQEYAAGDTITLTSSNISHGTSDMGCTTILVFKLEGDTSA